MQQERSDRKRAILRSPTCRKNRTAGGFLCTSTAHRPSNVAGTGLGRERGAALLSVAYASWQYDRNGSTTMRRATVVAESLRPTMARLTGMMWNSRIVHKLIV